MPTATATNMTCARTTAYDLTPGTIVANVGMVATALRNDHDGTMDVRYVERPGTVVTYPMGLNLVTLTGPA